MGILGKMEIMTLLHKVKKISLLSLSLLVFSALIGCTSVDLPGFNGPSELQFNPLPKELAAYSDNESALGFVSPLELKFDFDWPVDQARLTRGFMPHANPRPHLGLDLAAARGTPIFASHGGHVIYAGSGFKGYGRFVIVEFGDRWATFYGHLDRILVQQGQSIKKGQIIGRMGRTGRATGNHLHFELRRDRKALDPIAFLPLASEWVSKKN
ncbi:MAG: hypothetical protein RJB66_1602 [Pseudomonadota bacterium]|jgi:murein DD-endopeptidase MepM/ murein hydrolase activator NlpD